MFHLQPFLVLVRAFDNQLTQQYRGVLPSLSSRPAAECGEDQTRMRSKLVGNMITCQ